MTVVAKSILLLTNQLPGYDCGFQKSGHARYLGGIIDHLLAEGAVIYIVLFDPRVDFFFKPVSALPYRLLGPKIHKIGSYVFVLSLKAVVRTGLWHVYRRLPRAFKLSADRLRMLIRRRQGALHNIGNFLSRSNIEFAKKITGAISFDRIIVDGLFNNCGRLSNVPHWIITHEVKFQRYKSLLEYGIVSGDKPISEALEASIVSRFDKIIAIQWDDADVFRQMAPAAEIIVLPVTFEPVYFNPLELKSAPSCLFVGSGSHHNLDGLRWFLETCWPQIRAECPTLTLSVCGTVCDRIGAVPAGVDLLGVVENLQAVYARHGIAVVPLRAGSGLKIKLVEALVNGQAVITTKVGAQGFAPAADAPFIVAESASDFATSVISFYKNPDLCTDYRSRAHGFSKIFNPRIVFRELNA